MMDLGDLLAAEIAPLKVEELSDWVRFTGPRSPNAGSGSDSESDSGPDSKETDDFEDFDFGEQTTQDSSTASTNTKLIEELLSHIEVTSEPDWTRVVWAVKSSVSIEDENACYRMVEKWTDRAYPTKASKLSDRWTRGNKGGGLSLGTLIHLAREGGWKGKVPRDAGSEGKEPVRSTVLGTDIKLDMVVGKNPRPRPTELNISLILEHDERWKGVLAWDEHASRVTFLADPPIRGYDKSDPWDDAADTAVRLWLADDYRLIRESRTYPVVERISRLNPFHPLRDWLDGLKWDGDSRLNTWLVRYMGCPDTPYTRRVGRWWMMQATARALTPGCQADYMLILEGGQGVRKSSALRALAGEKYFSDTLPAIGSKDFMQALKGKWILEFSELATMTKATVEAVKSLLPARVDHYRPSYGKVAEDFPRACVFAGSTNDTQYLKDATGNRRFWPVQCGVVDLESLKADREALWAEAVSLVRGGERYWPETEEDVNLCTGEQGDRYSSDIWTSKVERWLRNPSNQEGVTIEEILRDVIEMEMERWQHKHKIRIGTILRSLGWIQKRVRVDGGGRLRKYTPPKDWLTYANTDDNLIELLH